ncbi:GNAT family N-acetyltransferase [Halogeometricum limi]|uniref:L-amino acid N-acyltransferase YncA n=1 Tax=Halogeometricum limi TaxID=555875 RepID=A0A1I6FXI1_9EURY|nr:GNAT family N-acetyltransferase [Halogeometricum limi]SFR34537.1 L-amino acid N-acyltransferase YncA [Halogeometricum limi]
MSDQFTVRRAEDGDGERLRTVAESSMTASYALSPRDIEQMVDAEFGEAERRRRRDADDYESFVAETTEDDVLAGVVVVDGESVRRLHVDPERRGMGIGTALFERATEELRDRDGTTPHAVAMAANNTAGAFFERFGLEQVGERTVEVGGREVVEYVYAEPAATDEDEADTSERDASEEGDGETAADVDTSSFPDTVEADGETVYLGTDPLTGTEGAFVPTYLDGGLNEAYGYYCGNCASVDVSIDSMERLECANCGNTRAPDENYDGSYL